MVPPSEAILILQVVSYIYGLIGRGSCNETHRARAVRIVYGLPLDTTAENVLTRRGLDSLETTYLVELTEVVFKCVKG